MINKYFFKTDGFTMLEVVISVTIFSLILLAVFSFLSSMYASNSKSLADREATENARRALDQIVNEIKSAKSIYTPTTTAHQLSLETTRYLPAGETETFIDFFLCGPSICIKKENENPAAITPDSVSITDLTFSQISTESIKVSIIASYAGVDASSSIKLDSTASLRSH